MLFSPKYLNSMRAVAAAFAAVWLAACTTLPPESPPQAPHTPSAPAPTQAPALPSEARLTQVPVTELPGFAQDRLLEAWGAWLKSCDKLAAQPAWRAVCADARVLRADEASVRAFFTSRFDAYALADPQGKAEGMLTGYYEPVLKASLTRKPPF
ncbi:MAG: transglycosylase, partial [Burkholderiaceae bacterium]